MSTALRSRLDRLARVMTPGPANGGVDLVRIAAPGDTSPVRRAWWPGRELVRHDDETDIAFEVRVRAELPAGVVGFLVSRT